MPKKTLYCPLTTCSYTTRRELAQVAGCRGVHETPAEDGRCPHGHGDLVERKRVQLSLAAKDVQPGDELHYNTPGQHDAFGHSRPASRGWARVQSVEARLDGT